MPNPERRDAEPIFLKPTEREQQRDATNTVISEIGSLISSNLDLEQILQQTVRSITAHLHHANVAVLLLDPENPETLVMRARCGAGNERGNDRRPMYQQPMEQGVIGAAATSRQPILVEDVTRDERYISMPGLENIVAELALPILVDDELLGVLNVESQRALASEEIADLKGIVDQLGVAVSNARRYHEMQLLYETSQRISVAVDVADVVRVYLEQVAMRGRYACNIALYEFDEAGRRTGVLVRGRWTPATGLQCPLLLRMPYARDELDPLLDAGETVRIRNAETDPRVSDELRSIQAQSGRPALVMIPLIVRGLRIGLVILSYHAVHEWYEGELRPYQITAAQLATAIDSRQQLAHLTQNDQQIAVLEERRRLAAELHDSVTQLIFSVTLIAQSIGPAWRRNPAEGEQRVRRLLELSQTALAEMRALLMELRPNERSDAGAVAPSSLSVLHHHGLAAALRQYATHINQHGLQIDFDASSYAPLSNTVEETLYRIAQEALNNVVKHARASHVLIELRVVDDHVRMAVRDNGIGLDASAANEPHPAHPGMGLQTMRDRAEMLRGALCIEPAAPSGTVLNVMIPLSQP